jgi:putative transposase
VTLEAGRHVDIHRQVYNYTLDTDEDDIGSAYQHQKRLTEWKDD